MTKPVPERVPGILRQLVLAALLLPLLTGCTGEPQLPAGLFAFGGPGVGPGRFSLPRAVCRVDRHTLIVIDRSGRMMHYTPAGEHVATWWLPAWDNGTPTGMCVNQRSNLLVPDTHYHRILEYTPAGELVRRWGDYGAEPGKFIYPTDIDRDAAGNLYIAEYGHASRVQVFTHDGRFLRQWGSRGDAPGQFLRPMGLALTPDNRVVVADAGNHRLQVFATSGELLQVIGRRGRGPGEFIYPYDVCVDDQGRWITCEYGTHRIQVFTPDGRWLGAAGGPGDTLGRLANPWGVCPGPNNTLYIADYNNHRIQCWPLATVLDSTPTLTSRWRPAPAFATLDSQD